MSNTEDKHPFVAALGELGEAHDKRRAELRTYGPPGEPMEAPPIPEVFRERMRAAAQAQINLETELNGDRISDGGTQCVSADCKTPAICEVFWPGRKPLQMCSACADRALQVAKVLDFHLEIRANEYLKSIMEVNDAGSP